MVLLHDWDPIGVQNVPEAHDEYDSYVSGIYQLLASGASDERIVSTGNPDAGSAAPTLFL